MFVDLNSDLGESFGSWKMGNDDQILPVVTSANIACGFHAGDPLGILKTLRKAVELNVTIGAHVSLYNTIAHDHAQAAAVIDAIKMYNPELVLVALAGSHLVEQARAAGLKVVSEAFADRAYNSDGSLVSRRLDGAVLHDSAFVARRVVSMLKNGGVESIDGVFTPIHAETICLHGDTAGALEMSAAIKAELLNHHIEIRPFVLKHEEVRNV